MSTRKVIAAFLTAGILVACFAGCTPQNKEEKVAKIGSEVIISGDAVYPISCEDTLTYWMHPNGSWSVRYTSFGETPLGKEIEKNTGVKVNYIHPEIGQEMEQLQLLIASDELPGIVNNTWATYPGGPQTAIDDGLIYSLNDLIDECAPALKKVMEEHPDWEKQSKTDSGHYYAFPFYEDGDLLRNVCGPILRGDWLRTNNLSLPETIDEWENVLTAFKNMPGAESGFLAPMDQLIPVFAPGFDTHDNFYLDDGKIIYGPMTENYRALLTKLNDWYKKGLIDKDFAVCHYKVQQNHIITGKTGATFGYAGGGIGDWTTAAADIPEYQLVGSRFPSPVKGEYPEFSQMSSDVMLDYGATISKNCINPELAARFLDYGFTEEGHVLFNFGIEGVSFNWIDGYPTYSEDILHNPDGLSVSDAMGAYIRACYNGIMVQDQRYIEQYYAMPEQKDAQKEWSKTNMAEHLIPLLYVTSDESDRDSEVMTAVKTYKDETVARFITGDEPLENFEKYVDNLKAMGIEEAIAFRQSGYERYLKK